MLALRTTFDPDAAGDLETSLDLRVDDDELELTVGGASTRPRRPEPSRSRATPPRPQRLLDAV